MILYAIKHIPSGKFLEHMGNRGGTWAGLIDVEESKAMPRLFRTEHAAKMALIYWLRGTVYRTLAEYNFGDISETLVLTPRPDRKREEMTVVALNCEELP